MLDFPRWKVWLVLVTTVIGIVLSLPSILPSSVTTYFPERFRSTKINLGLDLAGGSHLLLEADTSDVAKQRLERMEESIRTEMRRNEPKIEIGDISTASGVLAFFVRDTTQLDAAVERARNLTSPYLYPFMRGCKRFRAIDRARSISVFLFSRHSQVDQELRGGLYTTHPEMIPGAGAGDVE